MRAQHPEAHCKACAEACRRCAASPEMTGMPRLDRRQAHMNKPGSLLDELRTQYESARESTQEHADVEGFQAIDARLRKAFRWLEKAVTA